MDKKRLKETLKELVLMDGIPSHEHNVREHIKKILSKTRAKLEVNNMGSLIAIFEGEDKDSTPVLVDAHMDEVGYIVQYIDKAGYIKVVNMGNIDARVLPSQKLYVHSASGKRYPGVVGMLPPHVLVGQEAKTLPIDQLSLDCGFNSDEEVKKAGIRVGSPVTFKEHFEELENDKISCKAIDDRVGCTVLLGLAEYLDKNKTKKTIALSFSVQEEGGLKGIAAIVNKVKPDNALVIEATTACDMPGVSDEKKVAKMGAGVAFTVADSIAYILPEVVDFMIGLAEKNKIKYQIKTPRYGGTNAGNLYVSYEGVKTGIVAIPARYIHSPVSVISLDDLVSLFDFAKTYVINI
jgi:tetrahedral aminopeptidase